MLFFVDFCIILWHFKEEFVSFINNLLFFVSLILPLTCGREKLAFFRRHLTGTPISAPSPAPLASRKCDFDQHSLSFIFLCSPQTFPPHSKIMFSCSRVQFSMWGGWIEQCMDRGGVHGFLKKGLREFLAHTLLHKNDLVCEQTHKPSDPAFSHLSKTPYWSTARVCYWPRQWERRDGKDGYRNMCCVHPASWINTAHLPHTHLPLYSPHWWSDWITTPPFLCSFPDRWITSFSHWSCGEGLWLVAVTGGWRFLAAVCHTDRSWDEI